MLALILKIFRVLISKAIRLISWESTEVAYNLLRTEKKIGICVHSSKAVFGISLCYHLTTGLIKPKKVLTED